MDEQTRRNLDLVWNTLDSLVVELGGNAELTLGLLAENRALLLRLTALYEARAAVGGIGAVAVSANGASTKRER